MNKKKILKKTRIKQDFQDLSFTEIFLSCVGRETACELNREYLKELTKEKTFVVSSFLLVRLR